MSKRDKEVNIIRVRRVADYLEEFGNNGVGKGVPVETVRQQVLDAFRKEIFDQITSKLRIGDISEAKKTPENEKYVDNLMKNTYRKFLSVIREFNRYRETRGMLKPEDFKPFDEEPEEETDDDSEEYADEDLREEEDSGLAAGADGEGPDPE